MIKTNWNLGLAGPRTRIFGIFQQFLVFSWAYLCHGLPILIFFCTRKLNIESKFDKRGPGIKLIQSKLWRVCQNEKVKRD